MVRGVVRETRLHSEEPGWYCEESIAGESQSRFANVVYLKSIDVNHNEQKKAILFKLLMNTSPDIRSTAADKMVRTTGEANDFAYTLSMTEVRVDGLLMGTR